MYLHRRSLRSSRRSPRHVVAAVLAVAGAVTAGAGITSTASAVAPINDNFADRVAIAKDVSVDADFTEATNEPAIDAEAGMAACGFDVVAAFPTMRTLWYDFTPTVAETIQVGYQGDGFLAAAVVTGDPGAFVGVSCSFPTFFDVVPGVTYHIAAVDVLGSGVATTMSLTTAPPAPTVSTTLDPTGTVDVVNNSIGVSGTYTCTSETPASVTISGQAVQTSGRFFVSEYVLATIDPAICDGAAHAWSATNLAQPNGLFRAGPVSVQFGSATVCNARCTNATIPTTTVRVRPVNGTPPPPPPPPAPTSISLTVDRTPVLDRSTNVITASGTFKCSGGDEAFLQGHLRQVANNGIFIDAFIEADLGQCTGATQRWSAAATQHQFINDVFAGGAASFDAYAYSCSALGECGNPTSIATTVSIKAVGEKGPRGAATNSLPAGVAVNIDRRATLDTATNSVTVTGTITCSRATQVGLVDNEVGQLVGRVNVRGYGQFGGMSLTCGGLPQPFSFQVVGANGRFSTGKAVASSLMVFETINPEGFIDSFDLGLAQGDVRLATVSSRR